VTANCLHPATYMATTMVRQSGVTPISTVGEGAEAILNLAVADELDGRSGQFYNGLRPSKANPQAYDDTAREQLRVLSLQLTGLAARPAVTARQHDIIEVDRVLAERRDVHDAGRLAEHHDGQQNPGE
jgi:hypothetical protein